jgi:hypothetical protein
MNDRNGGYLAIGELAQAGFGTAIDLPDAGLRLQVRGLSFAWEKFQSSWQKAMS